MELFSVRIRDDLPVVSVTKQEYNDIFCQSKGVAFGSYVFPSSYALSEYLVEHPDMVKGKRVLELGAGVGLAGLVCGRLGSEHVMITDGLSQIVDRIRSTIIENGLQDIVSAETLRWGEKKKTIQGYDIIIGSDLTYTKDALQIPKNVANHLATDGTLLLVHEHRPFPHKNELLEELKSSLEKMDFVVEETPIKFNSKDIWLRLFSDAKDFYNGSQLENPNENIHLVLLKCWRSGVPSE